MKMLKNFPNLRQHHDYDCGSSVTQSVLAYYGVDIRGHLIRKLVKTKRSGTEMKNMNLALKKCGLKTDFKPMTVKKVQKYIDRKIPVILLIQAWSDLPAQAGKKETDWENSWQYGHYVTAIGYDKNRMYFEDPESIFRTYLTYQELGQRWHDVIKGKKYFNYGLAVYGKKPQNREKPVPMG